MFTVNELNTAVAELQAAIRSGPIEWPRFGRIKEERQGSLSILNYTQQAMFDNEWTVYECVCRGLILNNQTGEVVARAFDKFFNWGQGERKTDAKIVGVTEKMDGSLGVSYRNENGETCIATRGSFVSEQAMFATRFARDLAISFQDDGWTLLFEIIYPENRIVIDYKGFSGLVLLAARHIETGTYVPRGILEEVASEIGVPVVKRHAIDSVDDLLAFVSMLDATQEGFVAEFSDGSRFKFKGEEYCKLAKAIQGLSFKNVCAAIQAGTFSQLMDVIPDEFCDEARRWESEILSRVDELTASVEATFAVAPKASRKEFALWVRANYEPIAPYLFAMMDSKDARASVMSRIDREMKSIGADA